MGESVDNCPVSVSAHFICMQTFLEIKNLVLSHNKQVQTPSIMLSGSYVYKK